MSKEALINALPHGSGINGEWQITEHTDRYTASNFYEPMDEAGFYDGVAYFTLNIPKSDPPNFKLQFNGKESQYLNRKYALREYLEDTIADWLRMEHFQAEPAVPKPKRGGRTGRKRRQVTPSAGIHGLS